MNVEERVIEEKKKIDRAKRERDQAEGKITGIKDRLKKEFKVGSIAETKKLLDEMQSTIADIKNSIEQVLDELDELKRSNKE